MLECTDKHFQDLLHAYELGLLSDDQRRELELHIMNCDHCLDKVEKLKQAARLMRDDPAVPAVIQEAVNGLDEVLHDEDRKRTRPVVKRPFVLTALPIILIVIILVFKPWNIQFTPNKEAIASENRLIIIPFVNLIDSEDPENLGQILANLLITDLAESEYIQVVSGQRTQAILKTEGWKKGDLPDITEITEMARKANAHYILTGSILQIEPHYHITVQLISITSDDLLAPQTITGQPGEDIFSVADRLSDNVKRDMPLPAAAFKEKNLDLAEVTTDSYQAYFYYTEGKQFMYQHRWSDAVQSFQRAIEYDSTFATAYYYLTRLLGSDTYLPQALKYSDKITRLEKYYIESYNAHFTNGSEESIKILKEIIHFYPDEIDAYIQLGYYYDGFSNHEKAIEYYKKVSEIDPSNKIVYNYISLDYSRLGDFEQALEANTKYIEMAPDEANPYDSRGQIYAQYGQLDSALAAYKKAYQANDGFVHSLMKQGDLYLLKGEYDKADSCYKLGVSKSDKYFRSNLRQNMAYIPLYQGKLTEALDIIEDGIQTDKIEIKTDLDKQLSYYYKYLLKAVIYSEMGDFESALGEYNNFASIRFYDYDGDRDITYNSYIDILLRSGNIEEAEQVADSLHTLLETYHVPPDLYYLAKGQINLALDKPQKALEYFNKYTPLPYHFLDWHWKGLAYLKLNEYDKAIAEFEQALNSYTITHLYFGIKFVKTYYYLGLAYEARGKTKKAAASYQKLIDIWKNADFDFYELREAKKRLDRLIS